MASLLEPPFMHPGGRGGTALWEAGVVGVIKGELRSLLVGTRALDCHGVAELGAVELLMGALPVCYLALLAFLCCSAETTAVVAPQ